MPKKKLNIVYEDKEMIVINKPYNKLCVATEKERENTLYHEVIEYEKKKYPKNQIFIVHRLDKDTSGLVIFAKNTIMKHKLQDNWENVAINREYVAIVEGIMEKKKDTLKSYIAENSQFHCYSTKNSKEGKLAITEYEVLKENKRFSLLKINIKTGRKNQIRVQLSDIGHPVMGDKKYGSKSNNINRLALHANKLEIIYPDSNKHMIFETKIPTLFMHKSSASRQN